MFFAFSLTSLLVYGPSSSRASKGDIGNDLGFKLILILIFEDTFGNCKRNSQQCNPRTVHTRKRRKTKRFKNLLNAFVAMFTHKAKILPPPFRTMPVGKNSQDLFPFRYDLLPFEGNLILFISPWAFEKNQLFYSDVENHVMQRNIRER